MNDMKEVANETLRIIEDGYYQNNRGEDVMVDIRHSIKNTTLYKPNDYRYISKTLNAKKHQTKISVINETTLGAAELLNEIGDKSILALNFASAKNPGGGFLNGSRAQEESLCRKSALYPTIKEQKDYYRKNWENKRALYTDHIIYSPSVPVFRNNELDLLDKPYSVSFITAPAVNAGVVRRQGTKEDKKAINAVMKRRIEKILLVAAKYEHETLILGAFGCGVFKNKPDDVANLFKEVLHQDTFRTQFKKIVFATYDSTHEEKTYRTFKEILGN